MTIANQPLIYIKSVSYFNFAESYMVRFASNRSNTVLKEKAVNNAKHHFLTKNILPDVSI